MLPFTVCEWIATPENKSLRSQHGEKKNKTLFNILLKIILCCCQSNRK